MKPRWFVRKGPFFFPASVMGWIVFIATLAYSVYVFIDIDSHQHSVSDTLMNFVFNLFLIGVVYSLIGVLTEKT